jgi:hypothetical protein
MKVPDRFFVGGASGLRVLRFADGRWIDDGTMPGFDRDVTSIVETTEGNLFVETGLEVEIDYRQWRTPSRNDERTARSCSRRIWQTRHQSPTG